MPHAAAVATTPAPSLSPEIEAQEILLPQIVSSATLLDTGARAATAGAALNFLQEVMQGNCKEMCRKTRGNRQPLTGIGDAE